ncbi:hypothetical protein LTR53_013790 [Teratosphaeriaceae sp. CCFEE 6253]|nr:hypothetical protein LTR53_013790 [Teratosphaeriaceae sp. CCFEE 6253]
MSAADRPEDSKTPQHQTAPQSSSPSAPSSPASTGSNKSPTAQQMSEPQTCTGCRKQKPGEDFWRRKRNNLTCNQCSERLKIRKAAMAAAREAKAAAGQQQIARG